MSKQTGLIRLDGKIGGISFYRAGGQDLAKTANGPSKEKIQTDPAFVRTRENNVEFGGSAIAAKSVRISLASVIQSTSDPRLVSRLTKIFKEINVRSIGTRGQRPITLTANRVMLENFEFDARSSFSSVFNAPFSFSNNADRNEGTISVLPFLPSSFIHAPAGATHFRLVTAIGVVSDYFFNTATGSYEPTEPTLNMLNGIAYGDVTELNLTVPVNFSLVATIPDSLAGAATVSVVQCFGIEFFQRIGAVDYLLAQGNALKVVRLF